jgi:hypothetical protein
MVKRPAVFPSVGMYEQGLFYSSNRECSSPGYETRVVRRRGIKEAETCARVENLEAERKWVLSQSDCRKLEGKTWALF